MKSHQGEDRPDSTKYAEDPIFIHRGRDYGLDHKVGSVPRMMWFSGNATQHYVYATDFMVKAI
jgi:hypothetical protein